ncbi:MAG: SDR family NAD(P)-dependent oxidoreductase [Galactobacter sp.]
MNTTADNRDLTRPLGTAVVTGGTQGIGAAITNALVERGFGVVATGRTEPAQGLGEHIRFLAVDHSRPGAERIVADQLDERFGPLTALVNNVGRRHNDLIGELEGDTMMDTLYLNVVSHMLLTQALVPHFGEAGGSVVNISSRLARVGMVGVSGYAASKGALESFTVAAAVELAPKNIRINAVAPGMTRTELIEAWLQDQPDPAAAEAEVAGRVPLGRLGKPEDTAGAVAFLASPEAGYITGAVLPTDGGYTVS